MTAPFPDSARIEVPAKLADQLFTAAEHLPQYDNRDYYDVGLQTKVHDEIRQRCRPEFDWVIEQVAARIQSRPYCVLVSGLRFDDRNRLFVGINRAFGELVARPYEKPRAQLVHYIEPATDRPAAEGGRYESENLHTDTADWESPVELISMVCVRPDVGGGGRSRVLDIDTLKEDVRRRLGTDFLERLQTQPVPWQVAPYRGGGLQWRTVLSNDRICWRRYTIDLSAESANVELSDDLKAALDAFGDVVSSAPGTLDFPMREGDLLFVDNHRAIHARTPISSNRGSNRLMIRSWIRVVESA